MVFEEKTLASERIYEGKVINLRKDKVTVRTGTSYREIVEHNGAAVIIPVNEKGNVIMVRQYRKPVDRVVLELPAGKIDPGEDAKTAAVRELREETGYRAENVLFLTEIIPCVGYSEEVLSLYLCTGLTAGETDFDENESIDICEYSIDELYDMVMTGKLHDGKSQVGILMLKGLREEGKLQEYLK